MPIRKIKIVNLCTHDIRILAEDGDFEVVKPDGTVARVDESFIPYGRLHAESGKVINLFIPVYGNVKGLPEPADGVVFIVSAQVKDAVRNSGRDRQDVLSPGKLMRGPDGQAVGCIGLSFPPWMPGRDGVIPPVPAANKTYGAKDIKWTGLTDQATT